MIQRFQDLWEARSGPGAVALGFFDGVHLGHRAVIRRAVSQAEQAGLTPRVFTFDPQGEIPAAKDAFSLLQSEEQKEELLEALGVREIICPDFAVVKDLSPEDFVRRVLLDALRARVLVCGFNYRFGKGAAGDVALLRALCEPEGVQVIALEPVLWKGQVVSSTRIRQAIRDGAMEDAAAMLGTPFSLKLPVTHGRQLGGAMDCPTANQKFPDGFTVPRYGVYMSRVSLPGGEIRWGVTNVGVKPTLDPPELVCETHILDFSGDLYDQTVEVAFLHFLRPEEKFPSVETLFAQIRRDIQRVRELSSSAEYQR